MKKHYVCNNCGYKWVSRKSEGEPAICPKCHSDDIELEKEIVGNMEICGRCGKAIEAKNILGKCQGCKEFICKQCGKECRICNKIFCKDCLSEEEKTLCQDCYEEKCKFCDEKAVDRCYDCGSNICKKHFNRVTKSGFFGDKEVMVCKGCLKDYQ